MHRNVSGDVKKCMNHAVELVGSFTDGYIIGTALQHMGIEDCVTQPDDLPTEPHELHQYKQSVVENVTTLAFHPPNVEQVLVTEMEEKDCCCGRESGERMIQCSSESRCAGRLWYHLPCLNMRKVPRGKWLCPTCTAEEEGVDEKLEHTKMVLWMGINDRIRYRAIRSNNGDAIIRHWRHDLVEFAVRNHYKYFILAHRLLANINGAVSPQLAHTLKWNRTVNISGGPDRNIEVDLFMEMLNRAYKESSKTSRGQLTQSTVERHSRMLSVCDNLNRIFDEHKCTRRRHGKPLRDEEVAVLASYVVKHNLTMQIPGRSFHGLKGLRLKSVTTPADMTKLRGRILQQRLNMFLDRHMVDDE